MKILIVFLILNITMANDSNHLKDMLSAKDMILRYEKMFRGMIDDDRMFDDQQMKQFKKLIESQFGINQLSNNFYKWKETKLNRSLIFHGALIDDGKTSIEIKNEMIKLKGTFKNTLKGLLSKRFVQVSVPVPKDCDESKVYFERTKDSLIIHFPKIKKVPFKLKKTPLKKNKNGITI